MNGGGEKRRGRRRPVVAFPASLLLVVSVPVHSVPYRVVRSVNVRGIARCKVYVVVVAFVDLVRSWLDRRGRPARDRC